MHPQNIASNRKAWLLLPSDQRFNQSNYHIWLSSSGVGIVKLSGSRQEILAALKLLAIKELAFHLGTPKTSDWVLNGKTQKSVFCWLFILL